MKKMFAIVLCLACLLGMVACTNAPATPTKPSTPSESKPTKPSTPSESNPTEPSTPTESKPTEPSKDSTMGQNLAAAFRKEIASSQDLSAIAAKLGSEDVCGMDCVTETVSEGFLNGFSAEISGFKSGVKAGPMIGTIPFIIYLFEAESAEAATALEATLKEKADLRWNICTEAAELVTLVSGNYVFFTMCPGEDF